MCSRFSFVFHLPRFFGSAHCFGFLFTAQTAHAHGKKAPKMHMVRSDNDRSNCRRWGVKGCVAASRIYPIVGSRKTEQKLRKNDVIDQSDIRKF